MDEIYDASEESTEDVNALRAQIAATDPLLQPSTPGPRKIRRGRTRRLAWTGGTVAALLIAVLTLIPGGDTNEDLPLIRLGGTETTGAPMAANDAMVEGSKMIAPWNPQFEIGPGAELPAGTGTVYRTNSPTPELAQQLFERLTPGASVEDVPENEGGGWRTPWTDGSSNLYVSDGGYWSYSSAYVQSTVICAEPLGEEETTPDCGTPKRPANLPSSEQALTLTETLVNELGLGNGEAILSYADDWGVSIEWRPDLGDIDLGNNKSMLSSWFNYGDNSELTYAGGQIVDLDRIGDYPTVDSASALEEAYPTNNVTSMPAVGCVQPLPAEIGSEETDVKEDDGAAYPEIPTVESTTGPLDAPLNGSATGVAEPAVEPVVEPVVEPYYPCGGEPTPVKLVKARRIHTVLWDANSLLWVVPAYEFSGEDGSLWTAMALEPSYIDRGETNTDQEPVVNEPGTSEGAEQNGDATNGWAGADSLIGMSEEEALNTADRAQIPARVSERDGEPQMTTKDYQQGRLNLVVEKDTVVRVDVE